MKKLRNLLLDCRSALRRADTGFARSELSARLDEAILELGASLDADPGTPAPETRNAQQVAYAWQMAARDLRYSQPELHLKLSERVLQLLDIDVLHDPASEIQSLQQRTQAVDAKLREAVTELAALRQVLADAVPTLDGNMPAAEAARVRLRLLVESAARGGTPRTAPSAPAGGHMLTPESLLEVAEGRRPLNRDERDWCIGEAMVLSGFQLSPAQLLADGDAALARLILDTPASH